MGRPTEADAVAVADLPEFSDPPVAEVALSLQFRPLKEFGAVHFGAIRSRFVDKFPKFEEHPPLERAVEVFGEGPGQSQSPKIEFVSRLPLPRVWFLTEDGGQLIQIQRDRFVHNWRKSGEEELSTQDTKAQSARPSLIS